MTATARGGYGPPYRVDGPPPSRPVYGLLQAAEAPAAGVRIVVDVDDLGRERWMNGVEVFPYPPDVPDVWVPCTDESPVFTKGFGTDVNHPLYSAATVWLAETCTSSHVWDQRAYIQRALTAFEAVESAGVASEFLTGARLNPSGAPTDTPFLADGVGVFPNGDTATGVLDGIALLEYEIALTGKLGLIHLSPEILTRISTPFLIDNKTGVLRTMNGTVLIPDAGYAGGGVPSGHDAGTGRAEWMYATGPVDIRRSETIVTPDTVSEALDRGDIAATSGRTNAITYRVERYYLTLHDGEFKASVLVDPCTSGCAIGGSS